MSPDAGAGLRRLVALDGIAPGIGKSTLAAAIGQWCAQLGWRVDLFREEEIRSRPAYGGVAAQFRAGGRVRPATLLADTADYLAQLDADGVEVAVVDALLPFIPSLLAWGYDEAAVGDFVADLTALLTVRPLVLLYLDGDPERALARAVGREGPAWLSWLIGRYTGVRAGGPVYDEASLLGHLRLRRRLTLRVVAECGWDVDVLDAGRPGDLLAAATAALQRRGIGP